MYTNRFISLLTAISLLAVTVLVVRNANATTSLVSATRFYSAWAKAAKAEASTVDSATRSYIAWGQAMQVRNTIDSGTRSYIAWGKALEAAAKLGESGVCSTTSQENIFARIPNNLDSATRSYIAWGLALQAKNDIHTCH